LASSRAGVKINKVASIYGKNNIGKWVEANIKGGRLEYWNTKKATPEHRLHGLILPSKLLRDGQPVMEQRFNRLQLPEKMPQDGSKLVNSGDQPVHTIRTEEDIVKHLTEKLDHQTE
jgi:hypothetical protein